MAPSLLIDVTDIDLNRVLYDAEAIEKVNPHRGAMRLLDAVVWEDAEQLNAIAYKDIRHDAFWVPGHVPGRPLFPGVLMLEASAQLASFQCLRKMKADFLGFIGAENVRFRGQVVPGDRFYVLGSVVKLAAKRAICDMQGFVNGKVVFEARIIGMVF